MKFQYVSPKAEMIDFSTEDIITTSGGGGAYGPNEGPLVTESEDW